MITQEQIDEINAEVDEWTKANPDEVKRIDDRCEARIINEEPSDPETRTQRCIESMDRLMAIFNADK